MGDSTGLHDMSLADNGQQRKLPVVETSVPRRIEKISFGIMDSVEIMNSAEFQVFERALYKVCCFFSLKHTGSMNNWECPWSYLCRCLNVVHNQMVY